MSNDFVKQQYNKLADNYLAGRDQFKNNKYLEKLNTLLEPNSTILDVGCGAGIPIDKWLIEQGHNVIGVDISERQIELAKENIPQGGFFVKDMSKLSKGEYKVNAIVSFYAIFHTPRETHQEILRKFYSFLNVGGVILITMGASDWVGKEDNFFGGEMVWSHFGKNENIKLVQNAGFKIILAEIDTTGGENHLVIIAKK
jgi:cyclopropane fatty-acyl-phospholipid synthase-like methyltransferase